MQGPSAAVGIAIVNTFGACGGVGPVLVGHMKVRLWPSVSSPHHEPGDRSIHCTNLCSDSENCNSFQTWPEVLDNGRIASQLRSLQQSREGSSSKDA